MSHYHKTKISKVEKKQGDHTESIQNLQGHRK
jgi:hypothetical protein